MMEPLLVGKILKGLIVVDEVKKGIVMDAFGTVVYIDGPRHRPFRLIWEYLQQRGRLKQGAHPSAAMRQPFNLREAWDYWALPGTYIPAQRQWDKWNEMLNEEITSIRAYPEVIDALKEARFRGFKTAICSNLAMPYAQGVLNVLGENAVDAWIWSFNCQSIKPESSIYKNVESTLDVSPFHIIMTGDSWEADVEAPRRQGWRSIYMDRSGLQNGALDLTEVLALAGLTRRSIHPKSK